MKLVFTGENNAWMWKSEKNLKDKKQVLRFAMPSAEKENSDNCHAIEKAKSKRTEEMKFA